MKKLIYLIITVLFAAMIAAQGPSVQPPHQYYGDVTVDGQPAPDGLLVVARIDGQDVAAGVTNSGTYGGDGNFYVTDPYGDRTGETITFYVQGKNTGSTAVFSNDPSAVSRVDLAASGISTPTTITTTTATSGGGGGGGGGAAAYFNQDSAEQACTPSWVCSEWLDCISGEQRRVCVDANRCEDDSSMPETFRECLVDEELMSEAETVQNSPDTSKVDLLDGQAKKKTGVSAITGAILGGGTGTWVSLLILFALIGGLLFFYMRRSSQPPFE